DNDQKEKNKHLLELLIKRSQITKNKIQINFNFKIQNSNRPVSFQRSIGFERVKSFNCHSDMLKHGKESDSVTFEFTSLSPSTSFWRQPKRMNE
ncbi:MAG: hypothetical protein ONB32_11865, partial [candidate division KSB1 bacterium]|nr:hypothetical protein [candidate division KSB1 bacterium]